MQIVFKNCNDKKYEHMLNNLLKNIFFDFQFWYELNLWDDKYESYSIIENDELVSKISQDCVDDINIRFTGKEEIVTTFGIGGKEHAFIKKIDKVILGDLIIEKHEMDFTGYIYDDINGLLGSDILIKGVFIIDLNDLAIYRNKR